MATRKKRQAAKSEREARAEPTPAPQNQTSSQQIPADSYRARVWEMHLRGIPKTRIALAVGINRETVAKIITACYAEVASDSAFKPARKLGEAVARMRLVQEQAWTDHDADDARERLVLEMSLVGGNLVELAKDAGVDGAEASAGSRKSRDSQVNVRYQSQRSQYLRVILDAEKEIARLEGLYDGMLDLEAGATLNIRVLTESDVARLSGARRGSQTARLNPADGESDGEVGAS